ncbi:MAG: PTS sugar transporter subunit IIC [Treponema sp.]|jgi:PTS system mannose-specific IIC component|nr:PTS sugar transporter subunit IIC [Treponema sp.]
MDTVFFALLLAAATGITYVVMTLSVNYWAPLLLGFIAGIFVGDAGTGLRVGATCALMSIGFYSYGGAIYPDYNIGAIFGVFVAKQSGDLSQGLVIASALALLMTLFEILSGYTTTVFQHGGDRALARRKLGSFERWHIVGAVPWFLGRFIPVFTGMIFIDRYRIVADAVDRLVWLKNGLAVVGSTLPAVGFALLLSYMDLKRYWPYMLGGYVLFAYMGVPTVGLAIAGAAAAGLHLKGRRDRPGSADAAAPADAGGA